MSAVSEMQPEPPQCELTPDRLAVARRCARWRFAGLVILLGGLVAAGVVYWAGSREPDYSNDPAMLGFNRAADRQMDILYGKQGRLIEDLNNTLKQPGTQAILLLIATAAVAAGCFHVARLLKFEAEPPGDDNAHPDTKL